MTKSKKSPRTAAKKSAKKKVSRQREWQLKMREQGLCWKCASPAIGSLCPKHLKRERERQRRLRGWKKRNRTSVSYSV